MLQVSLFVAVCSCVYSQQQGGTYGIPSRFLQDSSSFFTNRYVQNHPLRVFTHTLAAIQPQPRTPQGDQLELLPPLQHVVGTQYPAVDPGPGFRFPISQLLNPTPPPNLVH